MKKIVVADSVDSLQRQIENVQNSMREPPNDSGNDARKRQLIDLRARLKDAKMRENPEKEKEKKMKKLTKDRTTTESMATATNYRQRALARLQTVAGGHSFGDEHTFDKSDYQIDVIPSIRELNSAMIQMRQIIDDLAPEALEQIGLKAEANSITELRAYCVQMNKALGSLEKKVVQAVKKMKK